MKKTFLKPWRFIIYLKYGHGKNTKDDVLKVRDKIEKKLSPIGNWIGHKIDKNEIYFEIEILNIKDVQKAKDIVIKLLSNNHISARYDIQQPK